MNVVFIGHVDAGKSTISGQILLSTGKIDKRTIEKYEKEAKEKNRESWYLAYILDTSEDERARGKTVECGKANFETAKKRITLLDAPGHKSYVPSMIAGANQADIGALVISARKGEFEAGYDRGGQTLEHIMLAKTLGIQYLFILVNKMDESTAQWSKDRYDEITKKLTDALSEYGFKKDQYQFIPVSGYTGANLKDSANAKICPWYSGPTFFEALDNLKPLVRYDDRPLRATVSARFKDRGGLCCVSKVESGKVKVDDEVIIIPTMKKAQVSAISIEDECDVSEARSGENVCIILKGAEEEDCYGGCVIAPANAPGYRSQMIEAQIMITDLNESIPVLTAGYKCVMHAHAAVSECTITNLVSELNKKGKEKTKQPTFLNIGAIGIVRIEFDTPLPIEKYVDFPQLGRFTLRDKGKTIAIGKVMRLKPIA